MINWIILFVFFFFGACFTDKTKEHLPGEILETVTDMELVRTGAEQTALYFPLLEGKRIGVLSNQSGLIGDIHLVDTLLSAGFKVVKLFSPEHGFRGQAEAGEKVSDQLDSTTGLPVISLYGSNRRPTQDQLAGIDLMLFDLQDVGVRFYTYTGTLHYVMEACAEAKIPLIVLDRPNPNGGIVDGNIPDMKKPSFVCMHPVPILHGMTIGEFANMIIGERWITQENDLMLTVIPCRNYKGYPAYHLPVPPSPNLPNQNSVYLYASLCFFEGTHISIGRGTNHPFQCYGHPNFDGEFEFIPQSISGFALNPKHQGKVCKGENLSERGEAVYRSGKINLSYLINAHRFFKDDPDFFIPFFDVLAGGSEIRLQLTTLQSEEEIRKSWEQGLNHFKTMSRKYRLYE